MSERKKRENGKNFVKLVSASETNVDDIVVD